MTQINKSEAIKLFESIFNETKSTDYFNRDLWKKHSYMVAQGSEFIAAKLNIPAEEAFSSGLLHDIGKAQDPRPKRHAIAGYNLLMKLGYINEARAALTHDFPEDNLVPSKQDGFLTDQELTEISPLFSNMTYSLIDKIVQVADVTAFPDGFVLMEKRLLFVVMRCGSLTETFKQIIRASHKNIDELSALLGYSVYKCLPEVMPNTFNLPNPC